MRAAALFVLMIPVLGRPAWAAEPGGVEGAAEEAPSAHEALARGRAALSEQRWEDALKAAIAAMRLEPGLYDALLVRALAHEGLGDLGRAEGLLVAYLELREELGPEHEAREALDRVRAQKVRQEAAFAAPLEASVASAPVEQADDGRTRQERILDAIRDGRCLTAVADAEGLVEADDRQASSLALLGDAYRCAGRKRDAVEAYRRHRALGGEDPAALLLLRGLEAEFGEVQVRVAAEGALEVPRVVLELGDDRLEPDFRGADGSWVFRDLPTNETMTLFVRALGLRDVKQAVDVLAPGERREVEVGTEYVGVGEIRAEDYRLSALRVRVRAARGEEPLAPGQKLLVTAGEARVLVQSELGELEHVVVVPRDDILFLDPEPLAPVGLTVVGVPTGSILRVFVDGEGAAVERELAVPAQPRRIDGVTGVPLAPPISVRPLIRGSGGVFLEHPVLGDLAAAVQVGGLSTANATTLDWKSLQGVPAVTQRFEAWKEQRRRAERRVARRPTIGAVISGIAGAATAALAIAAGARHQQALALPGEAGEDALEQSQGLGVAAAIAGGSTAAALGVTVALGSVERSDDPYDGWDLE